MFDIFISKNLQLELKTNIQAMRKQFRVGRAKNGSSVTGASTVGEYPGKLWNLVYVKRTFGVSQNKLKKKWTEVYAENCTCLTAICHLF